jgi:predicted NACHT family NTPase
MIELSVGAVWLWDKYGDNIVEWLQNKAKEKGLEFAKEHWEKFQWQQAEQRYKEKSFKLYGTTRVLGNPEPTELEGIFTDLYILNKPLAARRYSIDQLHEADNHKLHGEELERHNGVALVKEEKSHRLFILGKPGAGKTTFMKYINLQAVQGKIEKTPIFITLREWTDTKKSLMEFITEQFAICGFPDAALFIEYLLEQGNAIVLFDGLDEVNKQHNQRILTEIKNFCNRYDKSQCLITCRIAATDYSFDGFHYVEVADFTPEQIEVFVSKWFKAEPEKGELFSQELKKAQHRGLCELAQSPLLLGMLCLAFADTMEFPSRRAELYEDAIDALLRKWDTSRSIQRGEIYKNLSHKLKKQLFAAIAHKTFSDNRYLLSKKELSGYLELGLKKLPQTDTAPDGELVLKAIEAKHGIFVERAQNIYSFAHLTFQEYFAASHIVSKSDYQKQLLTHITDPRWREVILLTASLLSDADDFFVQFRHAIDDLVRTDERLVKLLEWADKKESQSSAPYKKSACRIFYIFFSIALVRIRAHAYAHAHAFNIGGDFGHAHALAHALALDLNLTCIFDLTYVFDLTYAHTLAANSKELAVDYLLLMNLITNDLVVTYPSEQHITKNYDQMIAFLDDSIQQIHKWGFHELAEQLTDLIPTIPDKTAPKHQWKNFANAWQQVLQTQRDIAHDWQLTEAQTGILTDYLEANSLLLKCLNIATVSDREAIKANLLAPV